MPKPARRSLLQRLGARMERSQHVFLLGLVVAFAIEIVVDWNATFYEINVLRAQLGGKATHYAAILRLALQDPLASDDPARIRPRVERLIARVLEDEEVLGVRVSDAGGRLLVEVGEPLGARYPAQIQRDVTGMLTDVAAFRGRIARSRHRDLFQAITDTEDAALRAVLPTTAPTAADPGASLAAALALQDRLYDEGSADRPEDRRTVWSLGLVMRPGDTAPAGVVTVALRTTMLQRSIRNKLLKGLAITLFFLGVIAAQQLSARRAKLRLISLRDALAAAREALGGALPERVPAVAELEGGVAFQQAERLGGTVYDFAAPPDPAGALDVFVALPEGSGVDVAFASIFLRDAHRRLRAALGDPPPDRMLRALAEAYAEAPIHRRLSLCLLRADPVAGALTGVVVGRAPPLLFAASGAAIPVSTEPFALPDDAPLPPLALALFQGPPARFRGALPPGAVLVLHDDGLPEAARHSLPAAAIGAQVARAAVDAPGAGVAGLADALQGEALERAGALEDDLLTLVLRRVAVARGPAPVSAPE